MDQAHPGGAGGEEGPPLRGPVELPGQVHRGAVGQPGLDRSGGVSRTGGCPGQRRAPPIRGGHIEVDPERAPLAPAGRGAHAQHPGGP
ncbi:MAG: hypothetical protein ACK559_20160, partial [bacterium]